MNLFPERSYRRRIVLFRPHFVLYVERIRAKKLPTVSDRERKETPEALGEAIHFFAVAPLADPSASFAERALPVEVHLLTFENDYQVRFVKICIQRIPCLR